MIVPRSGTPFGDAEVRLDRAEAQQRRQGRGLRVVDAAPPRRRLHPRPAT